MLNWCIHSHRWRRTASQYNRLESIKNDSLVPYSPLLCVVLKPQSFSPSSSAPFSLLLPLLFHPSPPLFVSLQILHFDPTKMGCHSRSAKLCLVYPPRKISSSCCTLSQPVHYAASQSEHHCSCVFCFCLRVFLLCFLMFGIGYSHALLEETTAMREQPLLCSEHTRKLHVTEAAL